MTHRGVAAAFTVVTGHRRAGEPGVDWRALARVGGTVVVLMGVSQRATIAAELIAGGLDPATPVAAIRSATTFDEVVARCRLDELATLPNESPAVLVIGSSPHSTCGGRAQRSIGNCIRNLPSRSSICLPRSVGS